MKSRQFTVLALALVAILMVTGVASCTRAKPTRPEVSETATMAPIAGGPTVAAPAPTESTTEGTIVVIATATVAGPEATPEEVILQPSPTAVPGMPTPTSPAEAAGGSGEMPTPAVTLVIPLTPQVEILPTPTPVPQIPPGKIAQNYVVKPGDTLFGIAVRFGTTTEEIMRANNMTSDVLSVGQQLVVPVDAATAAQPEAQPKPVTKPPAPPVVQPGAPAAGPGAPQGGKIHIVKPGENLFRIALNYNVSMDAVAQANNIVPPWYIIYPGQQLVIP